MPEFIREMFIFDGKWLGEFLVGWEWGMVIVFYIFSTLKMAGLGVFV